METASRQVSTHAADLAAIGKALKEIVGQFKV
jgi:hypothetical protein